LAGVLGDDDHLRRHRVRIGLDVQPREAEGARADEGDEEQDDEGALLKREGDDLAHGVT
jgi:hypothetical protein